MFIFRQSKGCKKSTTQYAKVYFESDFGIDVSTKKVKKKINLLDLAKDSEFVNGIKNLCKVIDGTKDAIDYLDNLFKKIIQDATHAVVEEVVKNIFHNTPLNKFEGIADYISI